MELSSDNKKCFYCHKIKLLSDYMINNRKYQVAKEKGRCVSCNECEYKRAVKKMGIVRFNFESDKFEVINFENINQLNEYFKKD